MKMTTNAESESLNECDNVQRMKHEMWADESGVSNATISGDPVDQQCVQFDSGKEDVQRMGWH